MYRDNRFEPFMQHLVEGGYKCGHVWIPVCAPPKGVPRTKGCPVCRRIRNTGRGAEKSIVQDFHKAEGERQRSNLTLSANRLKARDNA